MELTVHFSGPGPTWKAIQLEMTAAGFQPQMRMIDDQPAFPDEDPEAESASGWRDLRLSLGSGMVTLRREAGKFRVIVWGNADDTLRTEQEAIAEACRRAVHAQRSS